MGRRKDERGDVSRECRGRLGRRRRRRGGVGWEERLRISREGVFWDGRSWRLEWWRRGVGWEEGLVESSTVVNRNRDGIERKEEEREEYWE